jgi:hypothetical protein
MPVFWLRKKYNWQGLSLTFALFESKKQQFEILFLGNI